MRRWLWWVPKCECRRMWKIKKKNITRSWNWQTSVKMKYLNAFVSWIKYENWVKKRRSDNNVLTKHTFWINGKQWKQNKRKTNIKCDIIHSQHHPRSGNTTQPFQCKSILFPPCRNSVMKFLSIRQDKNIKWTKHGNGAQKCYTVKS